MPNSAEHCVLLFESIHHVLAAERAFLQRGLWHDVIPTPRDIHTDCGMVVQFRETDRSAVSALIRDLDHGPSQMYRITAQGPEAIDSPWS